MKKLTSYLFLLFILVFAINCSDESEKPKGLSVSISLLENPSELEGGRSKARVTSPYCCDLFFYTYSTAWISWDNYYGDWSAEYIEIMLYKDGVYLTSIATVRFDSNRFLWTIPNYLAPYAGGGFTIRIVNSSTPSIFATSGAFTILEGTPIPAAPSNVSSTFVPGVDLIQTLFTDNATDETYHEIQVSINNGVFSTIATVGPPKGSGPSSTGARIFNDTGTRTSPGNSYLYRVRAVIANGNSSEWVEGDLVTR